MNIKSGKKILIFDGISGVPMAREIADNLLQQGMDTFYLDACLLQVKWLCKVRASAAKAFNKLRTKDSYYHFPKVPEKSLSIILEREAPDIVLVVGFLYRFVSPDFVKALKKELGFSLYLYDTDSCKFYSRRREFIFFLEKELTAYDKILSFSRVTTNFFRNVRMLNASYFPYGANPIPFNNPDRNSIDVLFVGSGDLRRIFLLEKIKDKVSIFGSRWERNKALMSSELKSRINYHPVWGTALHKLLLDSKIVLNITRTDFFGAETGLNLRIFEALSAGCFLLTDFCDEVKDVFDLGVEIETYRSSEELVEKVDYYLNNDDKRLKIAQKGYDRFCRDFTWDARVKDLISRLSN
jgi:spore maturation protein CgeB